MFEPFLQILSLFSLFCLRRQISLPHPHLMQKSKKDSSSASSSSSTTGLDKFRISDGTKKRLEARGIKSLFPIQVRTTHYHHLFCVL